MSQENVEVEETAPGADEEGAAEAEAPDSTPDSTPAESTKPSAA